MMIGSKGAKEILELTDLEQRRFKQGATECGVEISGGSTHERRKVIDNRFPDPIAVVNAKNTETADDVIDQAIHKAWDGPPDNKALLARQHLARSLIETDSNLAILGFDILPSEEQTTLAQRVKAIAERINTDDIMIGYTCTHPETIIKAEPDLQLQVQTFEIPAED